MNKGGRTGSKDRIKAERNSCENRKTEGNIEDKRSKHSRTEEVKSNKIKRGLLTGKEREDDGLRQGPSSLFSFVCFIMI